MDKPHKRLTYANVMSTIAVFLLLAGGTAFAAKQLGKNTVGPKQLKKNSVTAAKIKKGAVKRAKIAAGAIDATKLADGSVNGAKLADGSVTEAKIDAGSAPVGKIIAQVRKSEVFPFGGNYALGSFTQRAGEVAQLAGSMEVEFAATCTQPRSAQAFFLIDGPGFPSPGDIAGLAVISDSGAGTVRRKTEIIGFPGVGNALARTAPGADVSRKLDLFMITANCAAGSGIDLTGVTVDVIGTR